MKERPTSVTVFAIINLVMAGMGLLLWIAGLIFMLGLINLPEQAGPNPAMEMMETSTGFQIYSYVTSGFHLLATILIISASIGMFTLQPWARKGTIVWAVYSIVSKVVTTTVQHVLFTIPMLNDATDDMQRTGMIVGAVVGGVFILMLIGYHLLLIYMLTRPHVVDAFTPEPEDETFAGWDQEDLPEGNEA